MAKKDDVAPINYDDPRYRITLAQQAAASCTGAVITSFIVTPLDVVKIRLQTQQKALANQSKCFLYCNGLMDHFCNCNAEDPNSRWLRRPGHFNGTIDAFVKIGRTEGLSSLWSGLSPTLVLAIPATVAYFVAYEQFRLKLRDIYNRRSPENKKQQPFWIPLLSGGTARILSASIVSPLELIRTKMQSQKLNYYEVRQGLKILVQQSGVKGLWRGIFPTLLRDVPFSAIYWMSYETIKSVYGSTNTVPSFQLSFFAGFVSGSLAATITTPFDVVKTHQQIEFGETNLYGNKPSKGRTATEIFLQIYERQGIRGLFTGATPRVIRVAPSCAIMISSFEYGKIFFNRLANQRIQKLESELQSTPTRLVQSSPSQFTDENVVNVVTGRSSSRDML